MCRHLLILNQAETNETTEKAERKRQKITEICVFYFSEKRSFWPSIAPSGVRSYKIAPN